MREASSAGRRYALTSHRVRIVVEAPCPDCVGGTVLAPRCSKRTIACPSCDVSGASETLLDVTIEGARDANGYPAKRIDAQSTAAA